MICQWSGKRLRSSCRRWKSWKKSWHSPNCGSQHPEASYRCEILSRRPWCSARFFPRTPKCGRGRRADLSSQRPGFLQNAPAEQPIKAVRSYHIHSPPKEFFKVLDKPGWKPWTCLICRIDKEINVAGLRRFPVRDRSEYPNIARAMFFGNSTDLFAFLPQEIFYYRRLFRSCHGDAFAKRSSEPSPGNIPGMAD